jgi:thiol-disulfide isomerase/thioredoxin
MRMMLFVALIAAILTNSSKQVTFASPEEVKTLEIGAAAPYFKLPGVDGKDHALSEFKEAKLLLVLFTCNHCPTAQAYEERILKLHSEYKEKGVALVAISPNDDLAVRLDELGYTDVGDSFDDMKLRAKERGFTFPYLYDGETQSVSKAYGVVATPQAFLFDAERKLQYVGRIDDAEAKMVTSHDLRNAIDALLAGKAVRVATTRTFGCSTKWADKRKDAKAALEKWDREPVKLELIDEEGLKSLVKNDTDKLLVINLWATWCGPCVAELPEFVTMNRMYRGRKFKMVTITLDDPEMKEDALNMLEKLHVSSTNYLPLVENRDRLAEIVDKDWKGPIPHTVLIAPGGKIIYRKASSIEPLEVRRAIVDFLGRTYASK